MDYNLPTTHSTVECNWKSLLNITHKATLFSLRTECFDNLEQISFIKPSLIYTYPEKIQGIEFPLWIPFKFQRIEGWEIISLSDQGFISKLNRQLYGVIGCLIINI